MIESGAHLAFVGTDTVKVYVWDEDSLDPAEFDSDAYFHRYNLENAIGDSPRLHVSYEM